LSGQGFERGEYCGKARVAGGLELRQLRSTGTAEEGHCKQVYAFVSPNVAKRGKLIRMAARWRKRNSYWAEACLFAAFALVALWVWGKG
jgi:hypothetical protein